LETTWQPPVREEPQALADRLGLHFNDFSLLARALTHRSYINECSDAIQDNERLEFLGDAVLDFITGAWLYDRFPEMEEGEMTRMRSALVHTEQLAEFARQVQLGNAIRLGRGELQAGGRERPAILCDAFEALIGAMYIDAGIEAVQAYVHPLLEKASDDILINHRNEDPKSTFQEWAQAQGYAAPVYIMRSTSGPDHSKVFVMDVIVNSTVYGSGEGPSKQAAAKAAAQDALRRLGQIY
jgi:ribonuclease III